MSRAFASRKITRHRKRRPGADREDGWALVDMQSAPLGPGITSASLEEVLAALQGYDPADGWDAVADNVIPLFQRVRPYPSDFPEGVRTIVPPGVSVSFAIDVGPAFTHITAESLKLWNVSLGDVRDRAFANLELRAAEAAGIPLVTEPVDGVPLRTLQSGTGSASTFVLLPHRLRAIFGREPQYFIAPMRDVLVSLPAAVDRGFAAWLMAEFAAMDPNHLAPIGFAFRNGHVSLEALGDPVAIA